MRNRNMKKLLEEYERLFCQAKGDLFTAGDYYEIRELSPNDTTSMVFNALRIGVMTGYNYCKRNRKKAPA